LEDCYRPDLVPSARDLEHEHARHAANLHSAGVDLILVETMNSGREAAAAARAALATGLPFVVSFVCWNGDTLLSGEPLAAALERVAQSEPLAVAVNCLPLGNVPACLPVLRSCGLPFGLYVNLGQPEGASGHLRGQDCTPEALADHVLEWAQQGARIVGGCCGTTPEHTRAMARALSLRPR
jgi:S-methylmethionine-dependent homocysteine/selenocysteine methylase